MRIITYTLASVITCASLAQQVFPEITGETSDGKPITLPSASSGKYCIIAIASSKKAGSLLLDWYEPAYLRFVAKHDLFAPEGDIDVWFVPVFTGLNKAAYGPSMKKLREGADPDVARRVVFFKGGSAALIGAPGMNDRDLPYFFVVDPQGRITHREQGAFTDEKLDALQDAMGR